MEDLSNYELNEIAANPTVEHVELLLKQIAAHREEMVNRRLRRPLDFDLPRPSSRGLLPFFPRKVAA